VAAAELAIGNTSALHSTWTPSLTSSSLRLQKDGGSDVTSYDVSVKLSDTSLGALCATVVAAIGGKMNRFVVLRNQRNACCFHRRAGMRLLVALICCGLPSAAQNSSQQKESKPFSVRATHLLGFENAKSNCSGTLSIEDDSLQFQHTEKRGAHIKTGSVRDIFLGAESKQVGGLPMTLGKAAAPYGGGRVVSLFAHKNYDILTLEYVDADEGIHGAIFQLTKGQGELVKNELIARGVTISSHQDQLTKESATEARHENK
jgi:hypothetical protein